MFILFKSTRRHIDYYLESAAVLLGTRIIPWQVLEMHVTHLGRYMGILALRHASVRPSGGQLGGFLVPAI